MRGNLDFFLRQHAKETFRDNASRNGDELHSDIA
jgi:hypothetical protein